MSFAFAACRRMFVVAVFLIPSLASAQDALPKGFSPPQLIERVEPVYPDEARKEGLQGAVLVQIVVDRDGSIREAKIAKGLGHGFDEAALEAARKLRFSPAMQDGIPVSVQLNYEINFQLAPPTETIRQTATPQAGATPGASPAKAPRAATEFEEIGRASCRERVCVPV